MTHMLRVAALALVILPAAAQAPPLDAMDFVLKSVPDGPVARVRGQSIPAQEFVNLYQAQISALALQGGEQAVTDRVRLETALSCLSALVQRAILLQEAEQREIQVEPETLDEAWQAEIERLRQSLEHAGEKNLSESAMLEAAGFTRERARAELRNDLLVLEMRARIAEEQDVHVTKGEMKALFDEKRALFRRPPRSRLRQIFASFGQQVGNRIDPQAREQAKAKITRALDRIHTGESFEAVAEELSDAPDRARGGDLGLLPVQALPPFYVEAAKDMAPGDVSGVIESDMGFHIIKLIEREEGGEPDFDSAKSFIERTLYEQRIDEAVDAFCKPIMDQEDATQVYLDLERNMTLLTDLPRQTVQNGADDAQP